MRQNKCDTTPVQGNTSSFDLNFKSRRDGITIENKYPIHLPRKGETIPPRRDPYDRNFISTPFSSIWDLRVSLNNVYDYQLTKDTIVWSTAIKIQGYLVSRRFPANLSGVGECITPVKFQIGTRRPSGPVIFIQA